MPARRKIRSPEVNTAVCREGMAILSAMSIIGIMQRFGSDVTSCAAISEEWNISLSLPSIGDTANPGILIVSDIDNMARNEIKGILPLPELTYPIGL